MVDLLAVEVLLIPGLHSCLELSQHQEAGNSAFVVLQLQLLASIDA